MGAPVRRRHEASAWLKYSSKLESSIEVGNVKQHPGSERALERAVRELEVLHADMRIHSTGPRELHHSLRLIDRHNRHLQLAAIRSALTLAAADLQDPPWADLGDCLEGDITRVVSLRRCVRPRAASLVSSAYSSRTTAGSSSLMARRSGSRQPAHPGPPAQPPVHRGADVAELSVMSRAARSAST